jgi:hypothetical protein
MFSLIITVVAIALVVVLAIATVYYGGSAFKQGASAAKAATIVNQGQQIVAAMELFNAAKGRYPGTASVEGIDELVSTGYLTEKPTVVAVVESQPVLFAQAAYAADAAAAWSIPTPGVPTAILSTSVDPDTCKAVNNKSRGDSGIMKTAYASGGTQCYGSSESALTVMVSLNGDSVKDALGSGNVADSVPAAGGSGWLSEPGTSTPSTPSTPSGGASSPSGAASAPETPAEPPAPKPVERVVMRAGLNNVDWYNHMYTDSTFTVKVAPTADVSFGRVWINSAVECGHVYAYNPNMGMAYRDSSAPLDGCYVILATPGDTAMWVPVGSESYWVPVTIVP